MPHTLDTPALRRAMDLYLEALRAHREEIDSLNVYPVPDGDTGTNLLLTQEAVVAALRDVQADHPEVVGPVVARASLLGARGNSGVILSQVLRGLVEALPAQPGGREVADALSHASGEAYRAVARPAEGTALSVLRDAAGAARRAAAEGAGPGEVLEEALAEARASLERTPELLPELRAAGVVDAGGKGMVLLLDALAAAVLGRGPSEPVGPRGPAGAAAASSPPPPYRGPAHEVQYLLRAEEDEVRALRRALAEVGESVAVVGGGGLYNVHVHVERPEVAVDLGRRVGDVREVRVVDLREQAGACQESQARSVRVAEPTCALVAVVEGEGLERTFRSLGAEVVRGGPGHNPSVGELAGAIAGAGPEEVVVLPNHPNVLAAAERAAAESGRRARVVPTASVPEGLAAATAYNPAADLEVNARAMTAAAAACRAGELVRAVRDGRTPAGLVRRGQWLGMAGGRAVAVETDPGRCAVELLRHLEHGGAEVLTLVVGAEASEEERREVERALRSAFPRLELEVVEGGQPRLPFLLGVE